MDAIVEMAKMFKAVENPSIQGICIGTVLSPPPSLKIMANSFILDKSSIVVAKHLLTDYSTSAASVPTHGDHIHTVSDILQSGENVIVIPSIDNSTYFIIDKVGEI